MKKHFLTPLPSLLNALDVWDERVEQVQMEVDYNPRVYPVCNRRRREYREARIAFEDAHPELRNELDSVISLCLNYMTDVAIETYKQGAADLYYLLHQLEARGKAHKEEEDA